MNLAGIEVTKSIAAAGLKITRVLAIHDNGEAGGPITYERASVGYDAVAQAAPASPPPAPMPFSPGTSTTEVRVRAEFTFSD